jgi:hypothetical protein
MDTINAPDKSTLIAMLYRWIAQRPGLEFGNYGDVSAYRSELRSITKDGAIAKQLLRFIEIRDSITAADIVAAFPRAFSGRLTLEQRADGKWSLSYCTGQYWPTEYRRAVCAVLSSVIWDYYRSDMPSEEELAKRKLSAGDYLRKTCAREFGRGIAARFFN